MDINTMIYNIICRKTGENTFLSPKANAGIDAYIKDKDLEDFLNRFPDDMKAVALDMYMKPIMNSGAEQIISFFEDYVSDSEFDKISKSAFNLAYTRMKGEAVNVEEIKKLMNDFDNIYNSLSESYRRSPAFSDKASETLLDIRYAEGSSRCMSKRLVNSRV